MTGTAVQRENENEIIGRVLVRAYGGEPVILHAVEAEIGGDIVMVQRAARGPVAAYPAEHTFAYESTVLAAAKRAYEDGNAAALEAAWRNATPYVPI